MRNLSRFQPNSVRFKLKGESRGEGGCEMFRELKLDTKDELRTGEVRKFIVTKKCFLISISGGVKCLIVLRDSP